MPKTLLAALLAPPLTLAFYLPASSKSSLPTAAKTPQEQRLKLTAKEVPSATSGVGRRVPNLAARDLEGRLHSLHDCVSPRAVVLVIRDVGCPVSKRYAPELARIEADFKDRDVLFLYVNESEHNTRLEMQGEIDEHGFEGPYLHDPDQVFARTLGARTTGEVFVIDAAQTLVYRGAVDDQYGRGVVLPQASSSYLRTALEELLAGRRISTPATFAPGCFLGVESEGLLGLNEPLTYHDQIARIVQANCSACHQAGGAAPFELETYEQVRGRAGMVRYMVAEELMPPWFASDDCGPWKNDLRLGESDKQALLTWIANGMPEGDSRLAPLTPAASRDTTGWRIGEPDHIFALPENFEVPAEGVVEYMPFIAEGVVPEDLWIEKLQVLPGDPEVVHHATITFQPPAGPSAGAFREDLLGRLVPWARGYDGWRFLYGYLPGKGPREYGSRTARYLPKGSRIRFEMHYTPKGVPTRDRTRLGIVCTKQEPKRVAQTKMLRNFNVEIAPGASDVVFEYRYTVPCDAELRSFTPHMHLRGRSFLAELHPRKGDKTKLIEIPEWDPDWQFSYLLARKIHARKGDVIVMRGTFDNSSNNPNNPDPGAWVRDGQQIWDEMFMMALEWIRPREVWREVN